ncbi:MAG: Crp/Fnr family transcriptional regulator [Trueperaceae bacterium]
MTPTVDGSIGAIRFPPPPALEQAGWFQRELGKGEALYRVGDRGGTVYRVDEGLLKLAIEAPGGKERIVALVGPGDVLGDLGPSSTCFQETAAALSDQAVVRAKSRSSLPPDSTDDLLCAATTQLARLREVLEDAELPVNARLARTLLRLGRRFGHRADDGSIRITLPLTHDNLAAMVGAARETTSTALGQIRAAGLLDGTRGRYSFQPERLDRYACEASS